MYTEILQASRSRLGNPRSRLGFLTHRKPPNDLQRGTDWLPLTERPKGSQKPTGGCTSAQGDPSRRVGKTLSPTRSVVDNDMKKTHELLPLSVILRIDFGRRCGCLRRV